MNQLVLINVNRSSTQSFFAFSSAMARALTDISIPMPFALLFSFNKDVIIHPDPTPNSKINGLFLLFIILIAFSSNISVSGLGDSTSSETLNSYL